ncbi:MAG: class I SAM-dependent methyltransferase [Candidatus Methylomirabilales bacterium]
MDGQTGSADLSGRISFDDAYVNRVRGAYDLMADEYDIIDREVSPFYVNDYRILDHYVDALRPCWEGCVVLDVGCGTGIQTVQYARGAKRVYSLDFSEKLIQKLRAKVHAAALTNVAIIQSDATRIPLGDNTVDFVCASGDVIGHIPNFRQAIAEMARVCRPGGTVTLEHDNKWHLGLLLSPRQLLQALSTRGVGDVRGWTHTYLRSDRKADLLYKTFTVREMEALLAQHGLAITRRAGIHIFSAMIPDAYQESNGRPPPCKRFFTRAITTLGRLDFRIRELAPFNRCSYATVVVAVKKGRSRDCLSPARSRASPPPSRPSRPPTPWRRPP